MARQLDKQFRNSVLEVIKKHYILNGNHPVQVTIDVICEELNINRKTKREKVMRMINDLEVRGNIKIHRVPDSNRRMFEFVQDDDTANIELISKMAIDTDGLVGNVTKAAKELVDALVARSKELVDAKQELNYVYAKLATMEFFANSPDGKEVYLKTSVDSNMLVLINQAKNTVKKQLEAAATNENSEID
ncbi:MAG: hypothetical protein Q8910_00495 [Bacteroidota bacterium]|nr:hypothetical protein [Bacteroidota bacterium]